MTGPEEARAGHIMLARCLTAHPSRSDGETENFVTATLTSNGDAHSGFRDAAGLVSGGTAVRRLTPRECERLQGLPDDHTLIPYRGGMAADGPRYKAIGNGMAVPCLEWIGRRITMVEAQQMQVAA